MAVSTKPITANKIGALSKLANAGTIPPFIVTFVAFPPSTTELEIADWSAEKIRILHFDSDIRNENTDPATNRMLKTFGNRPNNHFSNICDSNKNID